MKWFSRMDDEMKVLLALVTFGIGGPLLIAVLNQMPAIIAACRRAP